jgi:hypothetical protein
LPEEEQNDHDDGDDERSDYPSGTPPNIGSLRYGKYEQDDRDYVRRACQYAKKIDGIREDKLVRMATPPKSSLLNFVFSPGKVGGDFRPGIKKTHPMAIGMVIMAISQNIQ